ncbi:MAG: hypothetical protein R3192_08700 [Woeseiaceae bacterium]|nr:hypothetical protein [Woeseiaceae bacterium]
MDIKRLSIGSITGLVVLYVLGVVIWEMLFAGFFAANSDTDLDVSRANEIIWATVVGCLFYAVLITLMMEARGGTASPVDGLKTGAIVGFLLWGTSDFTLYGFLALSNLTATIADTVLEAVRGGITGAVIALVLGKIGDSSPVAVEQ